jgi:alpha-1,6-mannosyltransferase
MHLVDITMFYAAEGGGVSTYLNAKGRWLAQRARVQHSILSPNVDSGGAAPALVHLPGVAVPGINGYRWPLSVRGTARLVRRLQPDLIEAGDAGPAGWAALRVGQQHAIPTVAFYHSDLENLMRRRFGEGGRLLARRYIRALYRQFDLVLAPSRLMVQQLQEMGVDGAVHQPLGIDVAVFSRARRTATLRQQLCLAPETRLLVYAGRFTPEKRLEVLIEAVRRLGRPYHLLLIGAGQVALPPAPHTSVIAFRRDQRALARLLASCDLLVHPGDCETFGLIVLEAMSCGLPVVATTSGGIGELVDDASGLLVRPNSSAALSEGIAAIFQRDLAAMSAAACHRAHTQYDWNRIMPQLMRRYASLLALRERSDLGERICVPE